MTEQDSLLPTDVHERLLKRAEELSQTLPFDEVVREIAYFEHPELFQNSMSFEERQNLRQNITAQAENLIKCGKTSVAEIRRKAISAYFSIQKSMYEYDKRCAERAAVFRANEKAQQEKRETEQKARQAEEAKHLAAQREQEQIKFEKDVDEAIRFHAIRDACVLVNLEKQQNECVFRSEPIKWVQVPKPKKPIITKNLCGEDDIEERPDGKQHLISYQGMEYRREEFLKSVFPEYKKYPYKVKFNTDDIYLLGGNQRAKLQYHILAQYFPLVHVSEQDKEDLQLLCSYKSETARRWANRMTWEDGLEKMISFGVALEVRGKARKMWCYSAQIDNNTATYTSASMTWEKWTAPIISYLDKQHKALSDLKAGKMPDFYSKIYQTLEPVLEQKITETALAHALSMLFFQEKKYLTLPGDQVKILQRWIYDYWESPTAFPYSGEINGEEYEFTIDFNTDIEIVRAYDLKTEMPEYNQEHNAEHNKAMGYKQTKERFEQLTGDAWTTQEILDQGFSRKTLDKFVKHGLLKRTKRGHYERNSVQVLAKFT